MNNRYANEPIEVQLAYEEAKKHACKIFREESIGFSGIVVEEMIRILKEQGIEWEPKRHDIMID